jgi:hypothetical protein
VEGDICPFLSSIKYFFLGGGHLGSFIEEIKISTNLLPLDFETHHPLPLNIREFASLVS